MNKLKQLRKLCIIRTGKQEEFNKCYSQVNKEHKRLEKAMKLIDEKQVAWGLLIRTQSAEEYNKWTHEYNITQEEYDFLRTFVQKEMLEKSKNGLMY